MTEEREEDVKKMKIKLLEIETLEIRANMRKRFYCEFMEMRQPSGDTTRPLRV